MASQDDNNNSKPGSSSRGIWTLADLKRTSRPNSDAPHSSGMPAQDPTKGTDVDEIFKIARQEVAAEGRVDTVASSSGSFSGTGRFLSGETVPAASEAPMILVHDIVFWYNGFTVNDGPLRSFDDPANVAFMDTLKRSQYPEELAPEDKTTEVRVNLTQMYANYPEPEKQTIAFQGVGRTLGGSSSSTTETSADASAAAAAPLPSGGVVVDPAQPSTRIQLRMADGTRMVGHFNYHHTINDIRAFIDSSRPEATRTYHLQTVGFPPKQLNDLTQTIDQAGLANSVIIQKL